MQERWRMNKLGFVNFWLYDWEEFPFSEGRLLLRGENGAGKSVTTQSFIPFMLDGDLRPYRLDSFGSKDRKMSYYLLGEEKEESTGYLYLEFIKPEHRLYRTLVVGLRARRSNSTVEFWGFCLSDGRRIGTGPEDFALFETKGSQHKLELWQSRVLDLDQQLDALSEDLLACTERIRRQQAEQRKTKAALEELERYLAQPEVQALAQKLEELNGALTLAQKQYHDTDTQIQLRQNDLDHQGPDLTRKKRDLENAIGDEETLRQIFEEELCRGPGQPGRGEEPLWRQAEAARDHIRQKDRNLGPEDLRTSLEKNMRIASTLNTYRIGIQPLFSSEEGRLRSRVCIELYLDGQRLDLLDFIRRLEGQREAEEQLLSREDRRLCETILNQTIITKLSHRINSSQEWTQRMSGIMEQLNTSMGLRFSLVWKGKPADQQKELDTGELLKLLRKDPALMGDADRQKITDHFRAKINRARERSQMEATPATYSELMREALDFRNWFTFRLFYQKGGAEKQAKKELTDSAFNSFSGGEKAMAMYVPLFAALAAQYIPAGKEAPQLMALDEAFAGVDETNIESMFALVHELGFDYIMNSQALWGCYPAVSSLNIAELWRPQNAQIVTVLRYHWDGHVRRLEES